MARIIRGRTFCKNTGASAGSFRRRGGARSGPTRPLFETSSALVSWSDDVFMAVSWGVVSASESAPAFKMGGPQKTGRVANVCTRKQNSACAAEGRCAHRGGMEGKWVRGLRSRSSTSWNLVLQAGELRNDRHANIATCLVLKSRSGSIRTPRVSGADYSCRTGPAIARVQQMKFPKANICMRTEG